MFFVILWRIFHNDAVVVFGLGSDATDLTVAQIAFQYVVLMIFESLGANFVWEHLSLGTLCTMVRFFLHDAHFLYFV
jgi:hypothetical protein